MHIVNGRHDNDNTGKYTYIREIGASVIDYVITPSSIHEFISKFEILSVDISNHHRVLLRLENTNKMRRANYILLILGKNQSNLYGQMILKIFF